MKQTTKNAGTDMALGMCFGAAVGSVIDSLADVVIIIALGNTICRR